MRWKACSSGCSAARRSRRRSSSPSPAPGSCCACRWRRCAPRGAGDRRGLSRLRADARQHHARLRTGHARATACCTALTEGSRALARQPAGGGRDARRPRPRRADARAFPAASCATRAQAMSRRIERLAERSAQRAEDALAAGGHARRRPGRRRAAPHRAASCNGASPPTTVDADAVAQRRQLFAAAGAGLPGRRGWSTSFDVGQRAAAPGARRGPPRPSRPGLAAARR